MCWCVECKTTAFVQENKACLPVCTVYLDSSVFECKVSLCLCSCSKFLGCAEFIWQCSSTPLQCSVGIDFGRKDTLLCEQNWRLNSWCSSLRCPVYNLLLSYFPCSLSSSACAKPLLTSWTFHCQNEVHRRRHPSCPHYSPWKGCQGSNCWSDCKGALQQLAFLSL